MSKATAIPIWFNKPRKVAVEKLFCYAEEYYLKFKENENSDDIHRFVEHFLLFLSAAAQNLMDVSFVYVDKCGVASRKKILTTLRCDALRYEKKLRPVVWTWYARNLVAHSYCDFAARQVCMDIHIDNFDWVIDGFYLLDIQDNNGNLIEAPSESSASVFRVSLDFWKFVYQYVLTHTDVTERISYKILWKEFERSKEKIFAA